MVVQRVQAPDVALAAGTKAALLVCDRRYLRQQRAWQHQVAEKAVCRVVQIGSDMVVPVEVVTDKAEYAARTFRPKLKTHLDDSLIALRPTPLGQSSLDLSVHGIDLRDLQTVLAGLKVDTQVGPVSHYFRGGLSQAKKHLRAFINENLSRYAAKRHQPHLSRVSYLSPYLHFGQLSAFDITYVSAIPAGKWQTIKRPISKNSSYGARTQ